MKYLYILALLPAFFSLNVQAQQTTQVDICSGKRFTSATTFKSKDIASTLNVAFGTARNWKGETDTLEMDLFYPSMQKDEMKKRPLVVLLFPGGFKSGKRQLMHQQCMLFASKGFVAVSIDYRVGWYAGTDCNGNVDLLKDAVYRAVQDGRAALRYCVANAEKYGIDTSWIFVGGSSAGAATALHIAFATQNEINTRLEKQEMKFGGIDASTNKLNTTYTIKGVINMWGALLSDLFIEEQDRIPVISFHGSKDDIVPYYIGRFCSCYAPVEYPIIHGSQSLSKRLSSLKICNELNTDPKGLHMVFDDVYIVNRAACFLRSIMCGNCTTKAHERIPADFK
jgi:acetyl esterase/lipase